MLNTSKTFFLGKFVGNQKSKNAYDNLYKKTSPEV